MKINKKKKVIESFLIVGMLAMLILPLVSAIALTGDYTADSPVKIAPGETKEIVFRRMQNTGDTDITVELEMTEGSEIASLIGESSIVVPAGTLDTEVKLIITMPEVAEGTEYSVAIKFTELALDEGDMVSMTKSKISSIAVLVETPAEPEEGISTIWYWIIAIIIVIIIIWFIMKKKK